MHMAIPWYMQQPWKPESSEWPHLVKHLCASSQSLGRTEHETGGGGDLGSNEGFLPA